MTDDEALALAVRLVACKHFRPMPGMRDLQGRTWTPDLLWRWNRTIDRPDLRDPATLGCLLALVREAYGAPLVTDEDGKSPLRPAVLYVLNWYGWYYIHRCHKYGDEKLYLDGTWSHDSYDEDLICCDNEAETLVDALEAAP